MASKRAKLSGSTLTRAAKIGLRISDPAQFQLLSKIDVVVLGKAGVLTDSKRKLVRVRLAYGSDLASEEELLGLAAAVASESDHSVSRAITFEAIAKRIKFEAAADVREIPGAGAVGVVNGDSIYVGGPGLLNSRNIPIYVDDLVRADAANQLGNTVCYIARNSELIGLIEVSDALIPEAAAAVEKLRSLKIRTVMLTGDVTGVAEYVAAELGIKEFYAEIIPARKAEAIRALKADGSKVLVVGRLPEDGLALAEGQAGLALDSAEETKSNTAGMQLDDSNIVNIVKAISLSRLQKSLKLTSVLSIISISLLALGGVLVLLGVF
jgi:cation transport ATPase